MALVAALLLVFQSLASAFGASAAAAPLDAFGNPICVAGAGHPVSGGHDPGGDGLPFCCKLGCPSVPGAFAAPAEQAAWLLPLSVSSGLPPAAAAGPVLPERKHRPGNPRAPPPAA